MTHRFNLVLLVLLLAIGLPTYWFLFDNRPGDIAPKPVSMAQLRALAASGPGSAPSAIQFERIVISPAMRSRLTAGRGLRYDFQPLHVFRVDYGKAPAVLIDTGPTREQARGEHFATYDERAARRIVPHISAARAIVPLGTGTAHIGMLDPRAPARTSIADPLGDEAMLPSSPAKGIAVLAADEVREGTRVVFVRLAGGNEYLFVGDIARVPQSWEELRAPSRLDTDVLGAQDRAQTYAWLKTIRALKDEAPDLIVVPRLTLPKRHAMAHGFPALEKSR